MGFFQNSVINKHLKALDKVVINAAYAKFKECFHNPEIQHNIREAKEEQFQEGFLRELFVKVLGYTLNPQPNYNLTTELKNEKGANKADGAILQNGKALAVIELKGTDTKDLDKINTQAFNYKNNQTGCIYVITSNFEKLRFFIQNSVDHLEFNLFTLTEQEFELLWLCLNVDCLLGGIPLKVKEESLVAEENVTKQLYKDYATFRIDLWQNMVKNRPDVDQLLLFKKTQKLLDRFLFIFFAEDSGLLPPNSISRIVKRWNVLQEEDAYKPLYDIFNQYFGYINTGRKGKTPQGDIFAYNGGLFFPDEVLDNIVIDDDVLQPHVMKLTSYDFQSEIDVNILGHIFENSLSEIENVIAKLEGKEVDKNKTKRKKEGVFYTPKYITKYIVNNTVGKLCEEKKAELGIVDEEYAKGRRNRKKEAIKKLDKGLQAYRKWLLNITICDPACGSGAFLNQALEFLITEHVYIDELQAQLLGRSIVFQDVSSHILEKNIYGVDINEESVDIAKLSLWLRTAQRGRKLSFLNNNLKCGNSLIDDPEVAGKKAFNWHKEFPEIFEKYGFDVVIGNPPWGAQIDARIASKLLKKYPVVPSKLKDTYMYFQLLSIDILKSKGILGLIVPNTWLLINNTADYRRELLEYNVLEITDHGDSVFSDAIVESATIILKKEINQNEKVLARKYRKNKELANQYIDKNIWLGDDYNRIVLELDLRIQKLIDRINKLTKPFSNNSEIIFGIKPYQVGHGTPPQTKEVVSNRIFHSERKMDNQWKPLVVGTDITRYCCIFSGNQYIKYGEWLMYPSNERKILNPKILLRRTSHDIKAAFNDLNYYPQNSVFIITSSLNLKYVLAILNSRLMDRIYKNKCPQEGKIFAEIKPSIIKSLPVVCPNKEEELAFELSVNALIEKQNNLSTWKLKLTNLVKNKFQIDKISKKLQNWHKLKFEEFLKELKKAKVQLSLSEEAEWMQYFNEQKQKALEIKAEIDRIYNEIDQMVYELYGLTKEEIKIVEQE